VREFEQMISPGGGCMEAEFVRGAKGSHQLLIITLLLRDTYYNCSSKTLPVNLHQREHPDLHPPSPMITVLS